MTGTIDFNTSGRSVLDLQGAPNYTYAIPSSLYPSASASGGDSIVSGGISLNAGITGGATLTLGNYGLDYNVLIDPGVPTEDMLPDEVFTVDPSLVSTEDASFSLNGPAATANLFIGVKGSASIDVASLFSTSLPFTIGYSFVPGVKFDFGAGLSATISAPGGFSAQDSIGSSSSLPSLSASGHGGAFLTAGVDIVAMLQALITDGLPAISGSYGDSGGNISYSLLSLPLSASLSIDQSATITPTSIGVTVQEKDANGGLLASQNGTLGEAFSLAAPSAAGAFTVNETYELNYAVTSTTGLYGNISLTLNGPQVSGSIALVPFSAGPLGSVTLFQDSGHIADLGSQTVAQSISGGEQDSSALASTTLTASNATELGDYFAAIDASNLTNTDFTINLASDIYLSADLPALGVKPGSGDTITINGGGHAISGNNFVALTPTSGDITLSDVGLYWDVGASAAGAGSLTIDTTGIVWLSGVNTYTGGTVLRSGTLGAITGALGSGDITFDGPAQLDYLPGNPLPEIAGFGAGDKIQLNYFTAPAASAVTYNAATGVFNFGWGTLNFDPSSTPDTLYYWQGSGIIVSNLADYVALRSAPAVQPAQTKVTATQGHATPVSFTVTEAFPDVGETYTVQVHDTNGLLSLAGATGNGTNAITLTGALASQGVNLTLDVTSAIAGSDQLVFDVTDSYGLSSTKTVNLTINPLKPAISVAAGVTIDPNVPQAISGISLDEPNAVSGETYTVTVISAAGTLAATDGVVSGGTLTLTGDLDTVNADLATLTDNEPAAGPATLLIGAVDSFGNIAPTQTADLTVNPRTPTVTAPGSLTIGPILVSPIPGITLSEPDLAAGETFTVTVSSATGQLAANDGSFADGTLTLSGDVATVNADLATLTDYEPAEGTYPLVISAVDNFGYVAPAQTVDVGVIRLAPVISSTSDVTADAFGPPVTVAPDLNVELDQTGSIVSASVAITGGFQPGDLLISPEGNFASFYDANTGILTLNAVWTTSVADWTYALESVEFSSSAPLGGSRTLDWSINDGTLDSAPIATTVDLNTPITGKSYLLTPGVDKVSAGSGANVIVAADGALSSGDTITGNGTNYLSLAGAGTFDMRAPSKLSGIGTVVAYTDLPAGPETLYTRAGQSVTVNVVDNPQSGVRAPITIHGNADADIFNLSGWQNLIYPGSGNEVFNSPGDNIFVVTASTAGATINGSNETVLVDGGGNVTLGANGYGISQVTLDASTNLTYDGQAPATITATASHNTVTFNSAGQTFIGAAGGDTVNFFTFGPDIMLATAAALNGDVLNRFVPSTLYSGSTDPNPLTITDFNPLTATLTAIRESSSGAVLTLSDGTSTTTFTATAGQGYDGLPEGGFVLAGNTLTFDGWTNQLLPSTPFSFVGYGTSQTLEADWPLNRADSLIASPDPYNNLDLYGGGTYNLGTLAALSNFGTINVSETVNGTRLTLRAGLDATVNVVNASGLPGASITVIGNAADSSAIYLGGGDDTVMPLSNTESVFGGSGTDKYILSASTAGATIAGGSGSNTLLIAGGGTIALGDNISNMQTVRMRLPSVLTLNSMEFVHAIGSNGADTLIAGGANQTLTGSGGGDVLVGSAAGYDTFLDRAINLNAATIQGLVTTDLIDITDLAFARASLTPTPGPTGTTLNFTDGQHAGAIALDVSPTSNFAMASDGHSGTFIYLT